MKKEENRVLFEDVRRRIDHAKERNHQYEEVVGDDGLFSVAEIIAENKILINKFDSLMGQQYQAAKSSSGYNGDMSRSGLVDDLESEISDLSHTLIDSLYD